MGRSYRYCQYLLYDEGNEQSLIIKSILSKVKRTNETNYNLFISVSSWRKLHHSTALPSRMKHGRRRKDLVRWLWSPYSFLDLRRSTLDRWAGVVPLLPPVVVMVRTLPWCRTTPSSRWNQLPIVVIHVAKIICVAAKYPRTKWIFGVNIVGAVFDSFYFILWGEIETPNVGTIINRNVINNN